MIEESFLDQGGHFVYSDTRGVRYTVGSGNHARSFLVEQSGRLYEAPVTYFTQAHRWDMSPGYDTQDYTGFTRRVTASCLFCHAGRLNTVNKPGDVFQPAQPFAEMSIGCERCHGPGKQHLTQRGKAIVNPAELAPALRDQICEQCHLFGAARVTQPGKSLDEYRAGERLDTVLAVYAWDGPSTGIPSVVEHPLEMKRSICWQKSTTKMWCGFCHNVHKPKPVSAAFYRAKCLNCHARQTCNRTPDVSNPAHRENNCIACHMPKRQVIESAHVAFTDHRIRRKPEPDTSTQMAASKLRPILSELDDPVIATRNLGFAYAEIASSTGKEEFSRKVADTLQPLIGTHIADASFWQTLGEARLDNGEFVGAEEAFRKAIELDPGSASAHYGLGYLLQLRDRLPEAIAAYQLAVKADPYKAEAFGNLAAAYLKIGDPKRALSALLTGLELEPGNLRWRETARKVRP